VLLQLLLPAVIVLGAGPALSCSSGNLWRAVTTPPPSFHVSTSSLNAIPPSRRTISPTNQSIVRQRYLQKKSAKKGKGALGASGPSSSSAGGGATDDVEGGGAAGEGGEWSDGGEDGGYGDEDDQELEEEEDEDGGHESDYV